MAGAVVLVLALSGCREGTDTEADAASVMPDVMGLTLDVALSDIERAGVEDDVEILGGGTFGVVNESNWTVCEQMPAAGQAVAAAPRLTVDRTCEVETPDSTSPPTEVTAEQSSEQSSEQTAPAPAVEPDDSAPAPSAAPASTSAAPVAIEDTILTVETSADLAALLAGSDSDYELIEGFAAKYLGRTIEFDANIAAMSNHGDFATRYDILVLAGDYSETSATGPYFQFQDVDPTLDLGLTGSNLPDSIGQGTNLHVVARVGLYDRDSGLFYLEAISTRVR